VQADRTIIVGHSGGESGLVIKRGEWITATTQRTRRTHNCRQGIHYLLLFIKKGSFPSFAVIPSRSVRCIVAVNPIAGLKFSPVRRLLFQLLLIGFLAPAGCERQAAPAAAGPGQSTAYEVNGVVREILRDGRRVLIAHEAIAGYMEAMTMEFEAAKPNELAVVHPGDAISFRLIITPEHGWIEGIRVRPELRVTAASETPVAPGVEAILSVGDRLPDASLVDHTGRPFHLRDLRGRPLAFTFIFTRCPFPDYCPRLNTQFAAVQSLLVAGGAQLLSISIDPDYDTPARLTEYAARFQPNPAKWRFATGESAEIQRLGAAFGLAVTAENGTLNHKLRTVVVDATGRIEKVFSGNEWTAAELTEALKFTDARK
jgi:protein SCO1/2